MTVARVAAALLCVLAAGCGGGGGDGAGRAAAPVAPSPSPADPPANPPADPPTDPPAAPPTDPPLEPDAALARPLSSALLCGDGLARRYAAASANGFAQVGDAAGLAHVHHVDLEHWLGDPESLESILRTGAVIAGHLDADCWPDLAFTTGATDRGQVVVYRNSRGLGFDAEYLDLPPTGRVPAGLGAADLDGDDRVDLVVGEVAPGSVRILAGSAAGRFEPVHEEAVAGTALGFAFGDFPADGWTDIYVGQWGARSGVEPGPALLRNTADADAEPEAPAARWAPADDEAGLTLAPGAQRFGLSPGFVDLDFDGRRDLLVAADFASSEVLLAAGSSSFVLATDRDVIDHENAAGAAIRDFDNDGLWDWFVASIRRPDGADDWGWGEAGSRLHWGRAQPPYLTTHDANAGVEDAGWPTGVCAQDFNNDGLTDLFVENGYGSVPAPVAAAFRDEPLMQQLDALPDELKFSRARLFINQGDRTFIDESVAWGIAPFTQGRGVACVDYDRDGDIDIVVAQHSGAPLLYENLHSGFDGRHFVAIRLLAAPPNTDALGAVVRVHTGTRTQMQQVQANGNLLGQDALDLHFGLGHAAVIDAIDVVWPNGAVSRHEQVKANRFVTLLEPGLVPYETPQRMERIETALAAAVAYVAANPASMPEDVLAQLDVMRRMHGLQLPYSPSALLMTRVLNAPPGSEAALHAYRRLVDPHFVLERARFAQLDGFDAVTIRSLYCHHYPLDEADMTGIETLVRSGGYGATHALLALIWALDNGCAMPAALDAELLDEVIREVRGVAADGPVTDLRLEALAMLAATGRHDLLQAQWIDDMLAAQQPDGSWKADPASPAASGHSTGVALWLLMQLHEPLKVLRGFVVQTWE